MSNDDFLDFIAFVLIGGSNDMVGALDRALSSIRRIDAEHSTALLQYNKGGEILRVAFAVGGS